jgi:tetratricopeptide (TPR) repeat protein
MSQSALSKQQLLQILQRGVGLQRDRKFLEAERCYQTVLLHVPHQADALNLMGTLALEASDEGAAAEFFAKALKQDPKNPTYRHNLGNALMGLRDYGAATSHFRKALDAKPGQIESLCLIGNCYNQMSRAAEGLPFVEKAMRLQADHPLVRVTLADIKINLGKMDEAEAILKQSIERRVAVARCYQSLAALRSFTADAPELKAIEGELQRPDWPEPSRAMLHGAVAKMLNDAKHYDAAIFHFDQAKSQAARRYNIEAFEKHVDFLINLFDPVFLAARKDFGDASAKPVFILGMPRSGTTLTEQIISSHPNVAGAGELGEVSALARQLGDRPRNEARYREKLLTLTAGESKTLAQEYLRYIEKFSRDALRVTDKMPHNFEHIGLIALLFPKATIIHCRRDAIDNCMSCYMNAFSDAHGYNADFAKLGRYYRAYDRLMQHWHKVLPGRILDSRYETLVEEQEMQSRKLVAHMGLPWDDACLDYTANDRTVNTISRWQVRQPIYKTSVKRWKVYEKHIGPLIEALGPLADVG